MSTTLIIIAHIVISASALTLAAISVNLIVERASISIFGHSLKTAQLGTNNNFTMTENKFIFPYEGDEYTVEFKFYQGRMGTMEDPPEDEEVEILLMRDPSGNVVEMPDEAYEAAETYFWKLPSKEINEEDFDETDFLMYGQDFPD